MFSTGSLWQCRHISDLKIDQSCHQHGELSPGVCAWVCKFMQATECSQAYPTKTPPPLIPSPIWNTLIHRELSLSLSLCLSFSLSVSLTHCSPSLSFSLYFCLMLTGPSRKPKYVESPRIPSDAIASALRKVADNKESKQNGESCFRSLSVLFFNEEKNS